MESFLWKATPQYVSWYSFSDSLSYAEAMMEGQYLLLLLSIILMTTAIIIVILMTIIITITIIRLITTNTIFCGLYVHIVHCMWTICNCLETGSLTGPSSLYQVSPSEWSRLFANRCSWLPSLRYAIFYLKFSILIKSSNCFPFSPNL